MAGEGPRLGAGDLDQLPSRKLCSKVLCESIGEGSRTEGRPGLYQSALNPPYHQPALADLPGLVEQRLGAPDGPAEAGLDSADLC